MGEYGPPPARSAERRRTNSPDHPIWELGPDELRALPFEIDLNPTPPPAPMKTVDNEWKRENPDSRWGRFVTELYEAIKVDPMVAWMTSADWAVLMVFLEDLDRELKPQVIGISAATFSKEAEEATGNGVVGGEAITAVVPMKGAKMSALVNMLKAFGIGEANRLRMQKEVTLFGDHKPEIGADEGDIAANRLELLQGGAS